MKIQIEIDLPDNLLKTTASTAAAGLFRGPEYSSPGAPFENKLDQDSVADGLSQAQIAEALGVSPRQAKRIEDRAMRKIAELVHLLNITPEDLRT